MKKKNQSKADIWVYILIERIEELKESLKYNVHIEKKFIIEDLIRTNLSFLRILEPNHPYFVTNKIQ